MTTLQWSRRFPLRDAFTRNEHGGGLYLWGFDGYDGEVVWYVGKATTGKGVLKRLRKHYLDVMSGQYQIPRGFMSGRFTSPDCSVPAWAMDYGNAEQAEILRDWDKFAQILRAGHAFANTAFARVAHLDVDNAALSEFERIAIHQVNPVINKQRSNIRINDVLTMKEDEDELGWLDGWKSRTASRQREVQHHSSPTPSTLVNSNV